ncbi:Iron-sulfur cluster co-chaperone protein HscB, mitochondrial [Trichoplax sp. H2]|nr:Iron-sulfur cluster co-chaperone protein HscB, mitochondrial [Trichoplax sp. H2]|eukprot:RDD47323.1 Iron-sulfur cluster co-chaperone protein HscB, mitochondrial [Trichoplax sp. H2]
MTFRFALFRYPMSLTISTISNQLIGIQSNTILRFQQSKLLRYLSFSGLRNADRINFSFKNTTIAQQTYFSTNVKTCWSCQSEIDQKDIFFCNSCVAIQPPNTAVTFFRYFDSKLRYDMDLRKLKQSFLQLQAELHPDKFIKKSQKEKDYSAQQSALINEAYETLTHPLSRGIYMLELEGISLEERDVTADVGFLSVILDLNERVLNCEDVKLLDEIEDEVQGKLQDCIKKSASSFRDHNLLAARDAMVKMRYFFNIVESLKEKRLSLPANSS